MQLPTPLTCSDAGRPDVLLALLRHELTEEDEDLLLRHLRMCPSCLSAMAMLLSRARLDEFDERHPPEAEARP